MTQKDITKGYKINYWSLIKNKPIGLKEIIELVSYLALWILMLAVKHKILNLKIPNLKLKCPMMGTKYMKVYIPNGLLYTIQHHEYYKWRM